MTLQQQIGTQLKQARKSKKLSQKQLAQQSEIDQKRIGNIERGQINLTLATLDRIAGTLGKKPIFTLK